MGVGKLLGVLLIVAGVLGLVYRSFSYTQDSHEVKLGPLAFSIQEKKTVNVPMWAGVAAVAAGAALLLLAGKRR